MRNFWLQPRQIIIMDALSGRPAKNLFLRPISITLLAVLLALVPFLVGAWYAPLHNMQQVIPENLQLKRQNSDVSRKLADSNTLNALKEQKIESLEELIGNQEYSIRDLSAELHMFKSILEARKGTGVQVLQSSAVRTSDDHIAWQAVLVKGGSLPRFLLGSYKLFALDKQGNRLDLSPKKVLYRFETHVFLQRKFQWSETWQPTHIEFIIYNSARKKVNTQTLIIQGE
ncbi:MAG: hypothetical protein Q9M19_04145 [Mariprofundaceae bacterium]|nr:hypothetical protein [Mariprofundaceae bacterium]